MIRFVPAHPCFQLTNRLQHGRAVWRLVEPVQLHFCDPHGHKLGPELLAIPAGFETDGASIPSWARWRFDTWGRVGLSSVLHDYLLSLPNVTKWQADQMFLHALRSQGLPALTATLFYLAVRMRGRSRLG